MTTEHTHDYRILATNHNGRLGFEAFMTASPKYGFECSCGDVQHADLPTAARSGWIRVYNNDIPPAKFLRTNHDRL